MATTRDNMRYLSIVGDHQTDEIVDRVSQQCFLLAFPAHLLWSKIRRVTTMELTLSMKVKIYCKIVLKFSSGTAWSPAERWLMTANLVSSLRRIKNDFTIRKVVINRIFFGRQLFEKQFRKILDTRVLVLQAFGHLSKLTLDFYHCIQDQVRQHHQRILLDLDNTIRQATIQLMWIFVDDVWEWECDVAECDDSVAPDCGILRGFKDSEEEIKVFFAEPRADAE